MNKSFLKNIKIVTFGDLLSRIPLFIVDFLLAKFLGVYDYGKWSTFQIFVNYNNFIHIGTLSTLSRKIPEYNSKGKKKAILVLSNNIFSIIHIIAIVYSFVILSLYFFNLIEISGIELICLLLLIFIQIKYQFFQIFLQSRFKFLSSTISKNVFAFSLLIIVLIFYLISMLDVTYVIIGFVFSYLLSVLYIYKVESTDIKFSLKKIKLLYLKKIFIIGFPAFFLGLVKLISSSLDRIFILYDLGLESVGLYSFSFLFAMILGVLGGIFISVFSPYIMSSNNIIIQNKIKSTLLVLLFTSAISMIILFNFYIFVLYYGNFIEKFGDGYWITFMLFLTTYNMVMIQFFSIYLFKNNEYRYLFFFSLFLFFSLFIGNTIVLINNLGILYYAVSAFIVSFIYLQILLYKFLKTVNNLNLFIVFSSLLLLIYLSMYFIRYNLI